jgi:hypothetical protein
MFIEPPSPDEYAAFYAGYVDRVPDGDVLKILAEQNTALYQMLKDVPEAVAEKRPAPDEWSIKEVLGHMADGERIFAYRALRIARGDTTPLPGFDQDAFVPPGEFNGRPLRELLAEYVLLRASTLALFRGMPGSAFARVGTASASPVSVRALLYIIAGHENHHMESLQTVYLGSR